jgi:hypothetical protein
MSRNNEELEPMLEKWEDTQLFLDKVFDPNPHEDATEANQITVESTIANKVVLYIFEKLSEYSYYQKTAARGELDVLREERADQEEISEYENLLRQWTQVHSTLLDSDAIKNDLSRD